MKNKFILQCEDLFPSRKRIKSFIAAELDRAKKLDAETVALARKEEQQKIVSLLKSKIKDMKEKGYEAHTILQSIESDLNFQELS